MGDRRPLASFTSGDYDFPPASTSSNETLSAVDSRLASLRRVLEETREQARAGPYPAADHAAAERHTRVRPLPRFPADWSRRRRAREAALSSSRDSAVPSQRDSPLSSPVPDTPDPLPADQLSEPGDSRQRKRRKLHHSDPQLAFTYGHYGQVEPGRLKLHVESCDGDVHNDRGGVDYGPENILKHDKSVYCTRTSRCNIVLRHHDSSPFTLEKLHILAPENGFTAPLREGLVYVAMSRHDLLPHVRTSNQQSRYPAAPRSPSHSASLSLLESLNDPEISRAVLNHPLHRTREWSPFDLAADQSPIPPEHDDVHLHLDSPVIPARDPDYPSLEPRRPITLRRRAPALIAPDDRSNTPLDQDMQVVVLTDDDVTWPEDPSDACVLQDRQRRERTMAVVDDDDMYGLDARFRVANNAHVARGRRQLLQLKQGFYPLASPQLDKARNDGVTRARFQIKDGKHSVTIKFDPPVSGTHILLKLQTPYMGKNIDIQTVIASGYAGPRFFPAVQFS